MQRSAAGTRIVTTIRNRDKTEAIYLPQTHPIQTNEIPADSKLVFNKYGTQFFLSQVWIAGRTVGQELTKTAKERGLEREMAGAGQKPTSVVVAVKSN